VTTKEGFDNTFDGFNMLSAWFEKQRLHPLDYITTTNDVNELYGTK
jgi:hypothetical protein